MTLDERKIIGQGVAATHHKAVIVTVQPLTHIRYSYHVIFKITSGEMCGHVVSFRVIRRVMRFTHGDEVLIKIQFRESLHNGITHFALRGNIIEND